MFLKQLTFLSLFSDALSRRERLLEVEKSFLESRLQRLNPSAEEAKRLGKKRQRVLLELDDLREIVHWSDQETSLEHYRMLCMTFWQQEKCDVFQDEALKASVINCVTKIIVSSILKDKAWSLDDAINQVDWTQDETILSIIKRSACMGYLAIGNEVKSNVLEDPQTVARDWSTLYR